MFFSKLDQLLQDGQILNLNLLKKGDKIHINLVPKVHKMSEEAKNKLIPLSLNGTPAELDQGFFQVINEPVQERFGLISNVDAFRKSTKSAASDNKSPNSTGQEAGIKKDHKPSKKEQMIAEAEAHEKSSRWPEAYAIYKKLSAAEPENQKLKEKAMSVWEKMAQKPLFNFNTQEDEPKNENMDNEAGGMPVSANFSEPVMNTPPMQNTQVVTHTLASTVEEKDEKPVDMFADIAAMAHSM